MGPCEDTRRDIHHPQSWRGLSMRDRAVLSAWVTRPAAAIDELHTDVPVGEISAELRAAAGQIPETQLEAMYALRIDALLRTGERRFIVECKPWANAHALGQVLTYRALLELCGGPWVGAVPVVCCCGIDDQLRAVYDAFGIETFCVGNILAG